MNRMTIHFAAWSLLCISHGVACGQPTGGQESIEQKSIDQESTDQESIDQETGDQGNHRDVQVAALIEQLASPSFEARENATQALIEMGDSIERQVSDAATFSNPEISYRCQMVLEEIYRRQIAARQLAFLAGDVDQLKENAERWKRFESLVGNSTESRKLFVDMNEAAADMLKIAESNPQQCLLMVELICIEQFKERKAGKKLDRDLVAAVAYAGSQIEFNPITACRATSLLRAYLVEQDQADKLVLSLVGKWIEKSAEATPSAVGTRYLMLGREFGLGETVHLARQLMTSEIPASTRGYAMLALGQFGEAADTSFLEKWIDDQTILSKAKGDRQANVIVGDVAIAMSIVLTDQKLADFGFIDSPAGRPTRDNNYQEYNVHSERQRDQIRQAWKKWREKQQSQSAE